ncbi:hypothetical protein HPB52_025624 [Rhipicephalus sanguineus]|uniref:Ionotropic receptor n=1 Tax=Rhipicephalus sanguineus TaxID=34632 RepID=A0A9D4SME9_RHISA|nr:hypothetical protein HPB52_025624 [Rhipicephalus sanguineus]
MIEVLSEQAGFTYNMVCPDEGGTGIALPNGTWIGLVGDLYRNKSLDVEEYRKVWHLIVTHDGLREAKHLYDDENLREVLEGKAVIVSDYTTTLYHASQTCRRRLAAGSYYFAKEPTFSTKLSMAVSRSVNPELFQLINERSSRLVESGVIKAWMETQWGDWQSCLLAKREETYTALSLFETQSVFLLFLLVAGVSVVVFLAEIFIGAAASF